MIVVLSMLLAQIPPAAPWWNSTAANIGVGGVVILLALVICLWKSTPEQRAEIIRALAHLFGRGGPPNPSQ